MKAVANELGRAAVSKQGHDKGRAYLVIGVLDERYVLVADGQARKLSNPKKKQIKHLDALPRKAETVARMLAEGKAPQDSDIRKALQALADSEDRPDALHGDGAPVVGRSSDDSNKEECALVQK